VVDTFECDENDVDNILRTIDRHVCEISQQTMSSVRVPVSGQSCLEDRPLSFQWENLAAYAFPPFARVGKVVEQLSTSVNTQIILVAPCWTDRNWFQELLSLLIDHPRQLPEWDNLLHQPRLGKHHNIRMLRLHAWRISSDISLIRDFRKELPFFVARAQRKSKMAVYDSNWSRFVGWCSEREIDPFTVAISSIAEF